jgi:hypothetical protein
MHTVMFRKITEWFRRLFRAQPVSYELSDGSIITRCGASAQELVRLADIGSWCVVASDSRFLSIRLRDGERSIVVGDHRGALRELLQRVAGKRRVAE